MHDALAGTAFTTREDGMLPMTDVLGDLPVALLTTDQG
jgi:hypothetical protein